MREPVQRWGDGTCPAVRVCICEIAVHAAIGRLIRASRVDHVAVEPHRIPGGQIDPHQHLPVRREDPKVRAFFQSQKKPAAFARVNLLPAEVLVQQLRRAVPFREEQRAPRHPHAPSSRDLTALNLLLDLLARVAGRCGGRSFRQRTTGSWRKRSCGHKESAPFPQVSARTALSTVRSSAFRRYSCSPPSHRKSS
eukprot:scaffold36296_cov119-Isochrysis_galbana.AAC.2